MQIFQSVESELAVFESICHARSVYVQIYVGIAKIPGVSMHTQSVIMILAMYEIFACCSHRELSFSLLSCVIADYGRQFAAHVRTNMHRNVS